MAASADSEHPRDGSRYQLSGDVAARVEQWQRQRVRELQRLPVAVRVAMLRDMLAGDITTAQAARDQHHLTDLSTDDPTPPNP
jgi:hypothetical protein